LASAAASCRDVGDEQAPVSAQDVHEQLECGGVVLHLLQGDHVEPRDDLGDAPDVADVALGAVAVPRGPPLGHAAELAQVPAADDDVAVQLLGRR